MTAKEKAGELLLKYINDVDTTNEDVVNLLLKSGLCIALEVEDCDADCEGCISHYLVDDEDKLAPHEIIPNTLYRHFKGNLYKVMGLAKMTEEEAHSVIYVSLVDGAMYARPLEMFLEEVDHEKYPDITQKYRFERITE